MHLLSASSSSMSHSSMSPSLGDLNEDISYPYPHQPYQPYQFPIDPHRPALTPLSIDGSQRYPSPHSAIDGPPAYTDLRRGSLPTGRMDNFPHSDRPLTAPLEHEQHFYQPQSSDRDDPFAYNSHALTADPNYQSVIDPFAPYYHPTRPTDFLYGSAINNEQSRPPTRGDNIVYPAYVPDCQETDMFPETFPAQPYLVDPAVISGPSRNNQRTDVKPSSDSSLQSLQLVDASSRTITPSPTTTQKRAPVKKIIETYKNGAIVPIKRRGKLPKTTTELLKAWLYDHAQRPYAGKTSDVKACCVCICAMGEGSIAEVGAETE